jgi:Family of unknown function (DUF6263)
MERNMPSRWIAAFAVLVVLAPAQAQETENFRFKKGQVLDYSVMQTTRAVDANSEGKSELSSRMEHTKRWQVLDVDQAGVATLQLSIVQMKWRQQLPNGESMEFDTGKPDQGSKGLREKMAAYIGKPLAVIRLDQTGRVVEVKSAQGPASRFDHELPFTILLPGKPLEVGHKWTRDYQITLDPPLGTGEKYEAQQTYTVKSSGKGQAKITLETTIKNPPPNAGDKIPLLQLQPKGEVTFWSAYGLMWSAVITSGGTIEGHQGEGSKYEFTSEYRELLVKYQ